MSVGFRPLKLLGTCLLAGAAMLPIVETARSEIIPVERMVRGVSATRAQCSLRSDAVWVTVSNRGFCIRYYVSTAGGEGATPVVWLSGDKLGRVDMKTREFKLRPDAKDVDTWKLERLADALSKEAGTTAIYLARPGLDGSSGYHGYRRSWLELYIVTAALDAIKQRHGFRGFHLAGQSGGAGLIGGLMALREDIGCAVPGAGRLALLKKPREEEDKTLEFFDASEGIQVIARRRNMRILVVTDPEDQRVRAQHQVAFVRALRAAGGRVEQFFVQATDEDRHGVAVYTRYVVGACVRGVSNEQIAQGLARIQERHLAKAREKQERRGNAGYVPPARQGVAPYEQGPAHPYPQRPTFTHGGPRRTATGLPAPRRYN